MLKDLIFKSFSYESLSKIPFWTFVRKHASLVDYYTQSWNINFIYAVSSQRLLLSDAVSHKYGKSRTATLHNSQRFLTYLVIPDVHTDCSPADIQVVLRFRPQEQQNTCWMTRIQGVNYYVASEVHHIHGFFSFKACSACAVGIIKGRNSECLTP